MSEQQIEASNGKLRPGDFAGKTGLERQYNDLLQGTDGMRRVVVNSIGKEVENSAGQVKVIAELQNPPSHPLFAGDVVTLVADPRK